MKEEEEENAHAESLIRPFGYYCKVDETREGYGRGYFTLVERCSYNRWVKYRNEVLRVDFFKD